MDDFTQRLFEYEIRSQCAMAIHATLDLQDALKTLSIDPVWRHLQTILVASANLSKIFWGSQSGRPNEIAAREERRRPLRERFAVADDSPLRDTALRNDFEHFDERLEKWRAEHPQGNFVGRNIGPSNMIVIEGEPEHQRFQQFDPDAGVVTFWAHSVALRPLLAEIQRILNIP
jgi:hypothetical protein